GLIILIAWRMRWGLGGSSDGTICSGDLGITRVPVSPDCRRSAQGYASNTFNSLLGPSSDLGWLEHLRPWRLGRFAVILRCEKRGHFARSISGGPAGRLAG